MSTLEAAFGQLPQPILDKLGSMIRRVRRLLFIRGFFATLAVALACVLVIMAIDASVTLFSSTARWALSLTGLGITSVAAWWYLVRPLSRRFTLTQMARILEIRHPELQERISTAVELLSSNDPESIKGSEELIAAVVDSAVDDVATVDPKTEFRPARATRFAIATGAFAALLLLTFAIWPRQSWTLLARAVAPFLEIGNAYADSLVIEPGDVRIAMGDPLTIEMSVVHKRLRRAEVRRKLADGTETVERMTLVAEEPDGTKRFSLTFPEVTDDFSYRVRAGAALSRYFTVEAVEPPTIREMEIRYDYPDYTGLEPVSRVTETGEIRAVAHTRVTLRATTNKPLHSSRLVLNEDRELGTPTVDGNELTWEFDLKPGMAGSWRFDLSDLDGFRNEESSYPLEVLPDKTPTVQITQPQLRELELRPTERLPIEADVIEDFGFGDSALVVTPEGSTEPIEQAQSAPVPGNGPGRYHASALLDLAALDLEKNQRRLAVQLRVRDNRPEDYDGPGIGLSDILYITINDKAKSLADQAIEAQRKEVQESLQEAKQELQKAREDMISTERELNRDEEVNPRAREELEEFSERTETARERLDEVAALLDHSLLQEQADKARQLADETIAEARENADLVPVTDEKEERVAKAREAREKVEEALQDIGEMEKAMREAEDDYRMISQLNDIANRQQQLAMKADDWAEQERQQAAEAANDNEAAQRKMEQQQRQQMSQFQSEQNRLQQALGEMLKDNAAALEEVLEEQRDLSDQLAAEASALAEEQQELREMNQQATQAESGQQEALREELLARLQQAQEELASEAQGASEQLAAQSPPGEATAQAPDTPQDPTANAAEAAGDSPENAAPSPAEQANADSPSSPEGAESPSSPDSASPAENAAGDPAARLAEAADQAGEAARSLGEENLEAASESAGEAGETLTAAAESASEGEESGEAAPPAMADSGEAAPETSQSPAPGSEPPSGNELQAVGSPVTADVGRSGEESRASRQDSPSGDPAGPAETAGDSSETADAAPTDAASAGEETPPAPPTPAELADLAERQQALARQIEAVRDGNLQQALAEMEAAVEAQAAELQAEANALEQAMQNLSQRSAQAGANRAEQALQRGAAEANQAEAQLANAQQQQSRAEEQGQVEPGNTAQDARASMQRSQAEQQAAQNFLSQAANAFGQTSETIGRTMEGLEPSDMDDRIADSEDFANGFEEMSEASQAQDSSEAAEQSQQAADALQQLAQSAMQKLGQPGNAQPNPQGMPDQMPPPDLTGEPDSENLNETGLKTADADGSGLPPELQRLGISVEDWTRFRGALAGGNATAIETELPAEYRELVGRYFQVIAKEAARTGAK